MIKSICAAMTSTAILLLVLAAMTQTTNTASAATYSINKIQSGLVVSDSLITGNTTSWIFGGTATSYNYYEDSQGLHVGIKAPQNGQWVNYYAHLPQPNAYLFHTVVTIPDTSVTDGVSNVGLYVEGSDFIPHVGCEAYADSTGYYWDVEQSSDAGATYTILYISSPSSMPQTQDCTIITNGSNYLKVYIGGNLVFSSTTMNLGMSTPFIAFVQGDTSSSKSMHYGIYHDYYVTADQNIKVTNNPSNAATVKVVDLSGNVLSSSPVTLSTATLDIGKYHFPLSATINVYDSSNSIITSSSTSLYGGDVFSVTSSAGPPNTPTGLTATATSSSQINLSWTAPTDNGGSPITGYKIERSISGGAFSVLVANTASTGTTYSNTGLSSSTAYTYRISAINSVGTSSPSNTASATTSSPITAPSSPIGLVATAISSSQINLSWSAPTNNGGSAITGYKIERSINSSSTWSTTVANTASTTTTYSNTGLTSGTAYSYRASAINSVGTSSPSNTASATTSVPLLSINKINSGLVVSDPLNNETKTQQQLQSNPRYWFYGGDAPDRNAPYDFYKNTQGLHIGVQAPANGTWAGYYAVTPSTNAALFHAVVTTPVSMIPSTNNWYENGLYVQTTQPVVSYVTCVSLTSKFDTRWYVVSTTGNANQSTTFSVLYGDPNPNQPLTRDCTIITNGDNYLKVYLDGVMVYSSNTLKLNMPGPFYAFLEPQSNYAGQLLEGSYKDYYATSDEKIQVINLPNNAARVDLTDTSGVLVSASVSGGNAILDVGKYHFPLATNIKVYDSNNAIIASTSTPVNIFGGDVYSVS